MESSKGAPVHRRSALLSSGRRQIVDLLGALPAGHPGLSAGELADRLGVHVSTVRFHLERLAGAGVVAGAPAPGRRIGRPALRYALVAPEATEIPATSVRDENHLQQLTSLLMEAFRERADGRSATPEQLGERWAQLHARDLVGLGAGREAPARSAGQWFAKVGRVVDVLLAWGYEPDLSTRDHGDLVDIRLRDCPFLELARADPALICGIHRGLLLGAMREFGEPDSWIELEEFTDPPLCRVQISRTSEKENA